MNRPHVTLKLATSLDGRIATASGESRWITGEAARAEVHTMRAASDAVMIGAGTARADDPSLLARTDPPPTKQPKRVVVTSLLKLTPQGKLFESLSEAPLIVFGAARASPAYHAVLEGAGAMVELVPSDVEGIAMSAVLDRLGHIGVNRILAEGGGKLAASLIAANLVDRLEWFRAPIVLGETGRPAIAVLELARLTDAPRWKRLAVRALGPDLWESYERAE